MAQRYLLHSLIDALSTRIYFTSGQHHLHYRDQFDFFYRVEFSLFRCQAFSYLRENFLSALNQLLPRWHKNILLLQPYSTNLYSMEVKETPIKHIGFGSVRQFKTLP